MQGVTVNLRIDGHRPNSHFPTGPDDADGYLSPIRDENFVEQDFTYS
jgi:hypothetical protein